MNFQERFESRVILAVMPRVNGLKAHRVADGSRCCGVRS